MRCKYNCLCRIFLVAIFVMMMGGCAVMRPSYRDVPLTERDRALCAELDISFEALQEMKGKPLFEFSEQEIDSYLGYLREAEPDLRARVQHLARKTVGQDYRIYLLGEFPFEIYDPDPMYSLDHSDCVVFSEHMYAMALSGSWREFFAMLQRIRYAGGEIGMLTRNHYTIADWDRNNAWLVEDVSEELAGEEAARTSMVVNRANFFERFGIGRDVPPETVEWAYVPYAAAPRVLDALQPGDFVNIIRGYESGLWAGHVGLITRGADGTVNFLHSTTPRVKEQPLMELVETAEAYNAGRRAHNERVQRENEEIRAHNARVEETGRGRKKRLLSTKPYFYGFKFLRLREDPLEELRKIDGPDAPVVKIRGQ